jgi:serine/threonine protein kinase
MSKSLVGQQIKSYNVVKKLGEGAFAIVYQGLD